MGIFRREEYDNRCNVIWMTGTSQRGQGNDLRLELAASEPCCVETLSDYQPGFTALTRILRGPSSLARVLVIVSTAAFVPA
jgi:hypothetical protein